MLNTNQIQEKIQTIESKIEKGKSLLAKAEGKLETLEQQRVSIVNEISKLGISPSNINFEITNLERQIEKELQEIEQLLPEELR